MDEMTSGTITESEDKSSEVRSPVTCLRCGHEWTPKVAVPKKCPGCQNPRWDKPKTRGRRAVNNEVRAQECDTVSPQAESGQGTATAEEESGLSRIKQARERAEKILEELNG